MKNKYSRIGAQQWELKGSYYGQGLIHEAQLLEICDHAEARHRLARYNRGGVSPGKSHGDHGQCSADEYSRMHFKKRRGYKVSVFLLWEVRK